PAVAAIRGQLRQGWANAVLCVGGRVRVIVRHIGLGNRVLSRRAMLCGVGAAGWVSALSAFAATATPRALFEGSEISSTSTLRVGTKRKPANGARAKPWFGAGRGSGTTFAPAKLTPPDKGRFSLAAVGLSDWSTDGVEQIAQFGDLFPPERSG